MSRVIYKYNLSLTAVRKIRMPLGAEILSVGVQNDEPKLWALVDPNELLQEDVEIILHTTGNLFEPKGAKFLGTLTMLPMQEFVCHIFEGERSEDFF